MRKLVLRCVIFGIIACLHMQAAGADDKAVPRAKDAASAPESPKHSEAKANSSASYFSRLYVQVSELKALLEQQTKELAEQRERIGRLESELRVAHENISSPSDTAASTAMEIAPEVAAPLSSEVPSAVASPGKDNDAEKKKSPLSFKIGDMNFMPGGTVDLYGIFRSKNTTNGPGTSFGSIPFNNTLPQAALSEFRFTSQNSKVTLKVDGTFGEQKLLGYLETDFNGYQPPNGNVTTNSDSLRLRLYFLDWRRKQWEIQSGQMWTWMTPNRVGVSPDPTNVFYGAGLDSFFLLGLTWARQPGVRFVYHPRENWSFGLAFENPQQLAPSSVVFPTGFLGEQFDNSSSSTSAATSSTNAGTPNLHPDIIVKAAVDFHPGGRTMHIETVGLIRSFKVFNNLHTPPSTNTLTEGGASVNVNLELVKNFHLIGNTFYSDGGGRYIFGLGPDAIVRADGTLSAIHSGSGVAGAEWQATPHYLFFGYFGAAYFQRNYGLQVSKAVPAPSCAGFKGYSCIGFGFPGSSNSSNRLIQEATLGFNKTMWKNPNYGALMVITQYEYIVRSPWWVSAGAPKKANINDFYVDLRYALP
jgi:hypothetical protein